jgi:hypothetical protein
MLLIIAFIGIMLTIYRCRQPGVKFFTTITIFNRNEKLTPNGAKLYVVFFVMLAIGLVISFAGKSSKTVSATASEPAAEVITGTETGSSTSSAQSNAALFAEMTGYYQQSAETIAGLIPFNGLASGQLEYCNSLVEAGVSEYKTSTSTHTLRSAVRECDQMARSLCRGSEPQNAGSCEEYAEVAKKLIDY